MNSADGAGDPEAGGRAANQVARVTGVVLVGVACGVCLLLAFRSGAYSASSWLPVLIGVAALALVVTVAGPALSVGGWQKALLALFAGQAVWTAASILWAPSMANAWEETNRTLFYVLGVALVFVAVRWAGQVGLRALTLFLTGAIGIMALVAALRLGIGSDAKDLFVGGRLNYPVTYFNGLAALLMIGFWLALCLANAPGAGHRGSVARKQVPPRREDAPGTAQPGPVWLPRWTQPLFLALGVFLLELALLPQSRGALWTFFLVVPLFIILSPNRFRALVDLGIVSLPLVVFWSRLNGVYGAIQDQTNLHVALTGALAAIGYSVVIVAALWMLTWLIERRLAPLPRRLTFWLGVGLVVLAALTAVGALVYAHNETGGLGGYVQDRWTAFTSDTVGQMGDSGNGSRFGAFGLNGRLTQWKVAGKAFMESRILGIGAQNFEIYYYQHRNTLLEVRQPHSQPMQLLAELGLPGMLLWLAFVGITLVWAAIQRFRSSNRAQQAVIAAAMVAVISWFIHSSADWLWQLAAVSLPALLLLGGLLGAISGRGKERSGLRRVTRPAAALALMAVLASAAFPYLSLRYSAAAAGSAGQDAEQGLAAAEIAASLDPTSYFPHAIAAEIHAARAAGLGEFSEARARELELAAASWVRATEVEPQSWVCFYKAAQTFLAARSAARGAMLESASQLTAAAKACAAEARRLNPLAPQIAALEREL